MSTETPITSRLDRKGRLHLANVPRHLVLELTTDRNDVVKARVTPVQQGETTTRPGLFDVVLWLPENTGAVAKAIAVLDLVASVHRVNLWQVVEQQQTFT